jgi:hypothetical protein
MPLQNRVTPEGEIIATSARGTMMGNRGGCLHRPDKTLGSRRWVTRQWICCELQFRGRHREVMPPGRYTELFFLDEATALAAGHRPCFECRRAEALVFATLWAQAEGRTGRVTADHMDRILHEERLGPGGGKRTYQWPIGDLPMGTIARLNGRPHLVTGRSLRPWTPEGYLDAIQINPDTLVDVLTPPSVVALFRLGLRPRLHPTAGR